MSATFASLFAGIGGFDLAFERAGFSCAGTLGGGSGNRGWSPDTDRMTFVPAAWPDPAGAITTRQAKGVNTTMDDGAVVYGSHLEDRRSRNAARRLTPTECERLQGFPDDHTAGQPDSRRYKQMGNAVAVPVVQWIARRMAMVMQREMAA